VSPALHLLPASAPHPHGLRAAVSLALVLFAGAALASLTHAPVLRAPRSPAHHQEGGGLRVFLLTADGVAVLADGAPAHAGDRIQLTYDARAPHGVIWSVDSRGVRSLHFPSAPCDSTALGEGRSRPLPFSWELDDAPGSERFYFTTSSQPLDPVRVMSSHPGTAAFTLHKRAGAAAMLQLTTPGAPTLR